LHRLCKAAASGAPHDHGMITTTTTTVDRLLEVIVADRAVGDDIYAADATLDAVVPGWRLAVAGADGIGHQLGEWFADPGTLEELERHPTPTGEVLAYTVTWTEHGVPHAARHVHVLTIVEDRIVRDQFWCGGRWPAPLLAQMEAASR
jgi:hypothetical protein